MKEGDFECPNFSEKKLVPVMHCREHPMEHRRDKVRFWRQCETCVGFFENIGGRPKGQKVWSAFWRSFRGRKASRGVLLARVLESGPEVRSISSPEGLSTLKY